MAFLLPIDIINRGLAHLGKERLRTLTDYSPERIEGEIAYDNMRRAELRRNTWAFAIRRHVVRPVDTDTVAFTPSAYAGGSTYGHGAIVSSGDDWWESQVPANSGSTPAPGAYWQHYFGPTTASPYDSDVSYFSGEIVVGSDDALYRSLVSANTVDPVAVGTGWLALGGTSATLNILYPIGAGPSTQLSTRNVFRLPRGYLRRAPNDPRGGVNSWLGGPANARADDWLYEGGYVVTSEVGPLLLRYVADVTDVSTMDPMFCETLAAAIAVDIGPRLVGAEGRPLVADARQTHRQKRAEAIIVNGIEVGPIEPLEDDYLTVRY